MQFVHLFDSSVAESKMPVSDLSIFDGYTFFLINLNFFDSRFTIERPCTLSLSN